MPAKMFVKHLTSLVLMLILSFMSFKEGSVEAAGEFDLYVERYVYIDVCI